MIVHSQNWYRNQTVVIPEQIVIVYVIAIAIAELIVAVNLPLEAKILFVVDSVIMLE